MICCLVDQIIFVDTHSVPPIQNGVVIHFQGEVNYIIRIVAKTLRKRFHLSLGEHLYTSNHALTVLVKSDESINSSDKFEKSYSFELFEDWEDFDNEDFIMKTQVLI